MAKPLTAQEWNLHIPVTEQDEATVSAMAG